MKHKIIKLLKFKKFMYPFLAMFGFGIIILSFIGAFEIKTLHDFGEYILGLVLVLSATYLVLKIYELIASFLGVEKIYDRMFGDIKINFDRETKKTLTIVFSLLFGLILILIIAIVIIFIIFNTIH